MLRVLLVMLLATAHMADYEPGAAMYRSWAVRAATGSGEAMAEEHEWQKPVLPEEISDLVLSTLSRSLFFPDCKD